MSKTMVVRVKVRIDVDLDAYEREYGERVGLDAYAEQSPNGIKADLKSMVEGVISSHLIPLSNVYTVVEESA